MMTDFVEWKPEFDGHKPPHWRRGMGSSFWPDKPFEGFGEALWSANRPYSVPREAVYGSKPTLSDLKQALSKHSAEELAKHGITLAPEKDWATELWADLLDLRDLFICADRVRHGHLEREDKDAIELIRSRMPKDTGA